MTMATHRHSAFRFSCVVSRTFLLSQPLHRGTMWKLALMYALKMVQTLSPWKRNHHAVRKPILCSIFKNKVLQKTRTHNFEQFFAVVVVVLAPNRRPGNVSWKTDGSRVLLRWDHVKALHNESAVLGYKVSAVCHCVCVCFSGWKYSNNNTLCCFITLLLSKWMIW